MRRNSGATLYRSFMSVLRIILPAIFAVATVPALAQDAPAFSISVGAFFTDRQTQTKLDGDTNVGSDIDMESDLGLKKSDTVFRIDAYWQFAEHHRLDFSTFDLSRTGSKEINREIIWKDEIYPINAEVETEQDLTIYKAAYTWAFLRRERSFLGITGGLYIADLGLKISAVGIASSDSSNLTAPLPVIGVRGEYHFAERWSLRASAEFFAVEYGDYSGSLSDFFGGVDFRLTDTVALGLGVNSVNLNLGVDKDRFNGDLDWQYEGAMAYLKFDF